MDAVTNPAPEPVRVTVSLVRLASKTPCTVTVWSVFQLVVEKLRLAPAEIVMIVRFPDAKVKVLLIPGFPESLTLTDPCKPTSSNVVSPENTALVSFSIVVTTFVPVFTPLADTEIVTVSEVSLASSTPVRVTFCTVAKLLSVKLRVEGDTVTEFVSLEDIFTVRVCPTPGL